MVSNIEVIRLLKQRFPDLILYPSLLPVDAPEIAGTVELYSPTTIKSGLFSMSVELKIRSRHPKDAEAILIEVIKNLEGYGGVQIGSAYLLAIQTLSPVPRYIGTGVNGLHLYTTDFKFLMDVVR